MPELAYKHYLLGLLTGVVAFDYLDRFVLSLLLEPVKQDLQLIDGPLSLLSGFVFAHILVGDRYLPCLLGRSGQPK